MKIVDDGLWLCSIGGIGLRSVFEGGGRVSAGVCVASMTRRPPINCVSLSSRNNSEGGNPASNEEEEKEEEEEKSAIPDIDSPFSSL